MEERNSSGGSDDFDNTHALYEHIETLACGKHLQSSGTIVASVGTSDNSKGRSSRRSRYSRLSCGTFGHTASFPGSDKHRCTSCSLLLFQGVSRERLASPIRAAGILATSPSADESQPCCVHPDSPQRLYSDD